MIHVTTCHHSAMAQPLDLLAIGLRARPRTVAALAQLALADVEETRAGLTELAQEGYVRLSGDEIRYAAPDEAVADAVRRRAEQIQGELTRRLADLAAIAGQLPALARDWETGGGHGVLDMEVFHGPSAVTDLWHELAADRDLRCTSVVLPEGLRLAVADPRMQATWHDVISREGHSARVIVRLADATSPAAADRIGQELAGGVDMRLLADPPSWFWVADGQVVALPLEWGEGWPTSVMALHSPAVAGLAQWVFDRLWSLAVPVRQGAASWDPLLRLISGGATLEAASHALGISDRTGRRRLSDAMDRFGVGNLFALGVAWGRQQDG
jgi:hypothetical protein